VYNSRALSEIQRSDAHPGGDVAAAAGVDRDAKIEQLLLAGLDHYFAGQYDQAINVWTRALFIDRNHARARAYIERARGALAERQRQSEELLHNGVDAFRRGDGVEARRLIEAAIAGGAPSDEALAVLQRLDRPGPADGIVNDPPSPPARKTLLQPRQRTAVVLAGGPGAVFVAVLFIGLLTLGAYLASVNGADWHALLPFLGEPEPAAGVAAPPIPPDLSLPLPRRGEMLLARGRMLAANGRLHEALRVLDQIRATDPQQEDADRLRGDIQRQLLALTPMPPPLATVDRRVP
jgi:tetratricopeptide (TPR) repeat protein